jgi:hypothetical protein
LFGVLAHLQAQEGGNWVTLEGGAHVFIGEGGIIEKGPAGLIGRKPSELGRGKPGGAGKKVETARGAFRVTRKPTARDISPALNAWQESQAGTDALQARVEHILTKADPDVFQLDPTDKGSAIILGIRHGDEFSESLYRGIVAEKIEGLNNVKVGATFQMTKPQSFSKVLHVAEGFGDDSGPDARNYVFKTVGASRGLDVNKFVKSGLSFQREHEVVTLGRWKVASISKAHSKAFGHEYTVVEISQEAVF